MTLRLTMDCKQPFIKWPEVTDADFWLQL